MKIVSIGDIHGNPDWIKARGDLIVFCGDYVDDRVFTKRQILDNFDNIIRFKKANPDRVKLLLGNHDIQYILWHTPLFEQVKCTGFKADYAWKLHNLFTENAELFQPVFRIDNYLWTHAGLSNASYAKYIAPYIESGESIDETINKLWRYKHPALWHIAIGKRRGYSPYGSIFWADFDETYPDPLKGYHQIVGHSRVEQIITKHYALDTSITYTDCLSKSPETFYELELFFSEEKEAA